MGMAYDAARREVVMFGGTDGTNRLGDTWTWDGSTWTEQHPPASPPARDFMGMAYDAATSEVVLFGGCCNDETGLFDDTWTWDGTTWTQEHPPTSPNPRSGMGMAYHAKTQRIVIFGGEGGALTPTWTWDGTTWTQENPADSPQWVEGPGMSEYEGQVMMFGGEWQCLEDVCLERKTWVWDGRDWALLDPPDRPSRRSYLRMVWDRTLQVVVMLGGVHDYEALHDTWTWVGSDWARQEPPRNPPGRWGFGMAYDAARRKVVVFGGEHYEGGNYEKRGDTWTWDGVTWHRAA
jgi:hypothetical protein